MPSVDVKGMTCAHCVASVKAAIESVEGTEDVMVSLEFGQARWDEKPGVDSEAVRAAVIKAIDEVGFDAS